MAITVDIFASGPLTRLDWATHLFVQRRLDNAWWWGTSEVLKLAGNEYILYGLLGALSLFAAIRYRMWSPLLASGSVAAALIITIPGIKIITGRTAPHTGVDWMLTSGSEFPSGHAVNAIIIWGMTLELAVALFPRVRRWLSRPRRYTLIAAVAAASGLGMLGLDYHWLTDVLAGWLFGVGGYVAIRAWDPFRALQHRQTGGKPEEAHAASAATADS